MDRSCFEQWYPSSGFNGPVIGTDLFPTANVYALYCSDDSCREAVSIVGGTPDSITQGFPIDDTYFRESVCISSSSVDDTLLNIKPLAENSFPECYEECLHDDSETYDFIILYDDGKFKTIRCSEKYIFIFFHRLLLRKCKCLQKPKYVGVPRHLRPMQQRQ